MANLLIVEDDEDLAERIETWLEHEGHSPIMAIDGESAIEKLDQRDFDLLILDWDLPGSIKGIDVCKHYRQSGGLAPILMMTGRKDIQDKSEGFESGADDYLTKPFHLKELSLRVRALARRAPAAPAPVGKEILYRVCTLCAAQYPLETGICANDGAILATERLDPLIGTTFGERYEIESVLGSGGMSVVYRAVHKLMNKVVAIKVMSEEMTKLETSVKRFQLEAQAVSRLNHPNVVVVHDFGMTSGRKANPFMVMDYLEGTALDEIIDSEGQLDIARALNIFIQAAKGLAHAHEKGIIHRDVKPGNLVITKDEQGNEIVKLVDFGIAKIKIESGQEADKLTKSGEAFGTCEYMSPELCRGKEIDARSDMYSLGCLMFEALTGRCPFTADNYLQILQMQIFNDAPLMNEIRPDLKFPEELERIVHRTLEKKPEARYSSMSELAAELERVSALVR